MPDFEWSEGYGGHARLFRDRYLVGEVVWYHANGNLGERFWVGFAGRKRIDGRWPDAEQAQAAVEAALGAGLATMAART